MGTAVGLIPARAGNTDFTSDTGSRAGAHPRSRGEHGGRRHKHSNHQGSSPLARGTPVLRDDLDAVQGLIPARAGNTRASSSSRYRRRAHPRSRGEHLFGGVVKVGVVGSSPLARGTRCRTTRGVPLVGLIPARAGNTAHFCSFLCRFRAHPRSRGEHMRPASPASTTQGSSPLARGTLHRRVMRLD